MKLLRTSSFAICLFTISVVFSTGCGSTSSTTTTSSTIEPVSTPTTPASTSGGVSISSPATGATVSSPFTLSASAATCSSQTVTSMSYSLDSASTPTVVSGTSVAAQITAAAGAHTVNVTATGASGATCTASVAVTVPSTATASGGITISSPKNGASVTSPFQLTATATTCDSQTVTSIGYAVGSASSPTLASGTSLSTQVSASAGTQTVYLTAYGNGGATCTANVAVDVTTPSSPVNSLVPSNAVSVKYIEQLSNWKDQHDPGTGTTASSGAMQLVTSPVLTGSAREFDTSFSGASGELYYVTWGADENATNFLYDGWVYLTSSASNIGNLEMDMNQVVSNGDTIIYGFQCDGYSGTWDYTENAGTPSNPVDRWLHSTAACNVRNWSRNAWHHVQIGYSRDDSGNVTYKAVWLDGTEQQINATVPSAFALGWGSVLLTNFQVDGLAAGSNTTYLNELTISRW